LAVLLFDLPFDAADRGPNPNRGIIACHQKPISLNGCTPQSINSIASSLFSACPIVQEGAIGRLALREGQSCSVNGVCATLLSSQQDGHLRRHFLHRRPYNNSRLAFLGRPARHGKSASWAGFSVAFISERSGGVGAAWPGVLANGIWEWITDTGEWLKHLGPASRTTERGK